MPGPRQRLAGMGQVVELFENRHRAPGERQEPQPAPPPEPQAAAQAAPASIAGMLPYLPELLDSSAAQLIRIGNAFVVGPFMVWFGYKARGVPDWMRYAMMGAGGLTAVLSLWAYIAGQQQRKVGG